jgi:hypothetical protein
MHAKRHTHLIPISSIHPNNIQWKVQIMKLPVMQFSEASC